MNDKNKFNILKYDKLYNNYVDELIKLNPDWNLYLQIPKYKYLQKYYTNISKDNIKKQKQFYKKYEKLLEKRMNSNDYKKYPDKIKLYDKMCNENKMNIKEFHRKVLENGNVPLCILIDYIEK